MKNTILFLTHDEIMSGLSQCFRELIKTEVSNRNMPNVINRGKAVAGIVTAAHREEIMESRRRNACREIKSIEKATLKTARLKK